MGRGLGDVEGGGGGGNVEEGGRGGRGEKKPLPPSLRKCFRGVKKKSEGCVCE